MVKVQFVFGGAVKEVPQKMADLLIKIGKARRYEGEPAADPVVAAISPAEELAPVVEPVPVETPLPDAPEVAVQDPPAVEPEAPDPSLDFPHLETEDKAMEPEEFSDDPEAKPKRRYRRRDMKAEG